MITLNEIAVITNTLKETGSLMDRILNLKTK